MRWPDGVVCPKCGATDNIAQVKGKKRSHRKGLYYCNSCKGQFTVTVGTVLEHSRVAINKWLLAFYLMCASKKGMSAHQLHRTLGVTYKTAWFMAHRIREAMRSGGLAPPMGSGGGIVEVDETFVGTTDNARKNRDKPRYKGSGTHTHSKNIVLTLVDRTGEARSFHVDQANQETLLPIIRKNLADEARVVTDDAGHYRNMDKEYLHAFVVHSKGQYGRGEIHTNTVEGYYSIFKRGMKGVYQHCSEKHLHRYVAEFDFRYSNRSRLGIEDVERTAIALTQIEGKRLTYRPTNGR